MIIILIVIVLVCTTLSLAAVKLSGDISREEARHELEDYFTNQSNNKKD